MQPLSPPSAVPSAMRPQGAPLAAAGIRPLATTCRAWVSFARLGLGTGTGKELQSARSDRPTSAWPTPPKSLRPRDFLFLARATSQSYYCTTGACRLIGQTRASYFRGNRGGPVPHHSTYLTHGARSTVCCNTSEWNIGHGACPAVRVHCKADLARLEENILVPNGQLTGDQNRPDEEYGCIDGTRSFSGSATKGPPARLPVIRGVLSYVLWRVGGVTYVLQYSERGIPITPYGMNEGEEGPRSCERASLTHSRTGDQLGQPWSRIPEHSSNQSWANSILTHSKRSLTVLCLLSSQPTAGISPGVHPVVEREYLMKTCPPLSQLKLSPSVGGGSNPGRFRSRIFSTPI